MEIPSFTQIKDTPAYVKVLLYGRMGSGKTQFAASAPGPVWFDFERSTETLRRLPEFNRILVKRPKDMDEMRRDIKKLISTPEVKTIVWDTVTTSLDYFVRQMAVDRSEKPRSTYDRYEIWEADYKYATQVFTELFGILQDAPINVVIIGHEKVLRDDKGEVTGIVPDVTPRLQAAVARLVNCVYYLQATFTNNGSSRKLYVNASPTIEAKNRLNQQKLFVENPSWQGLFNNEEGTTTN